MLFVEHKTKLVYPSIQERQTGEEACRSNRETSSKCYNIVIENITRTMEPFTRKYSRKKLITELLWIQHTVGKWPR
jgi:hypothetical protein